MTEGRTADVLPIQPWFDGVYFEVSEAGVPAAPASPSEAIAQAPDESALAAGAGAGEAAAVAEPEAPVAPQEPQFDPAEVQAELAYLRDQNAALVQWAQQQGASPQQAQQYANEQTGFDPSQLVDEFGNLNPQGLVALFGQFGQGLLGQVRQEIQQIAAPLAAREEAEATAEGEQRLQDIIADDISRNGEFVAGVDEESKRADKEARDLVRQIAEATFPQVAERYGQTAQSAEIAISRAAQQVRNLLRAAGKTAVVQQVNHNATLAGVRPEPGTGAGSALVTMDDVPADPSKIGASVVAKYAARNAAAGIRY